MEPTPANPSSLSRMLADRLDQRRERQQFRARHAVRALDATHLEIEGRRCVNFAANNYLGLTHHPKLISMTQTLANGAGSGAAGLVSGYTEPHAAAEAAIAQWKGTEAAVILPSGYQANYAAIQTFAALADGDGQPVRFLIDKLAHASLIDAVRSVGLPFRIFPHNYLPKLSRLLDESDASQLQVVVTESIFSMDGDAADIAGIAQLKQRRPFALLIDEAHASGVYGDGGAGLLSELNLAGLADVSICTFSKAAGGIGGAVCGSRLFCDGLVNFGRAYIYSTAVPPWVALWAQNAVEIMREEPWRQRRVRSLAAEVRANLKKAGVEIPEGDSPIIPVILGDEQTAAAAANSLLSSGIFATAIRPPTVARGTSRLRLTLSCMHSDEEIEQLVQGLLKILKPNVAIDCPSPTGSRPPLPASPIPLHD
jgi:8-amino-7-oxononanoate synthase